MSCIVYGCPSNAIQDDTIQLFNFPDHITLQNQWLTATGWNSDQIDVTAAKICSLHFDETSFITKSNLDDFPCTKILNYDALPTLYLPTQIVQIINEEEYDKPTSSKEFIELQPSTSQFLLSEDDEYMLDPELKQLQIPENFDKLKQTNDELRKEIKEIENLIVSSQRCIEYKKKRLKEVEEYSNELKTELDKSKQTYLTIQQQQELLSKVFSKSQLKILCGKKKIYWSDDDMAIGYTIRFLSNRRFYSYLTKTLQIPLPAVSSVKRWANVKDKKKGKKKTDDS